MTISDDVLRAALEEYIAPGSSRLPPVEERLAKRLPLVLPDVRQAALKTAEQAADFAWKLAMEHLNKRLTEPEYDHRLAEQFPWLRGPGALPLDAPFWRRLFHRGPDLVRQLGAYGHRLAYH